MCDLITDIRTRIITSLQTAGISAEVAGMVATEVTAGVAQDWAGERPYIGHAEVARLERSRRDIAIRRDRARGESFRFLARKWKLDAATIYRICQG